MVRRHLLGDDNLDRAPVWLPTEVGRKAVEHLSLSVAPFAEDQSVGANVWGEWQGQLGLEHLYEVAHLCLSSLGNERALRTGRFGHVIESSAQISHIAFSTYVVWRVVSIADMLAGRNSAIRLINASRTRASDSFAR